MKPQDRPKALVLVIALVVVFVFIFLRLKGSSTPEAPPTTVPPTAAASRPAGQDANLPPGATVRQGGLSDEELAELDSSRARTDDSTVAVNPFRRTVNPIEDQTPGMQTAATASRPPRMGGSSVAGVGPMGLNPVSIDPMGSQTLLLQGVILGKPSLAIIRAGDEMMYVNEGTKLSDGIKVLRVFADYVVLRFQDNNYRLQMDVPRQLLAGMTVESNETLPVVLPQTN